MRLQPAIVSFYFLPGFVGATQSLSLRNPPTGHDLIIAPDTFMDNVGPWIRDHPAETACISVGVSVAAGALLVPPVLGAIGFGAGGVGATTAAASIHSSIGPVAAGSSFAWAQSVGAGGVAAGTLSKLGFAGLTLSATGAAAAEFRDYNGGKWLEQAKEDIGREMSKVGPALQGAVQGAEKLWVQAGPAVESVQKEMEGHLKKAGENVGSHAKDAWQKAKPVVEDMDKHVKQAWHDAGPVLEGVASDIEKGWKKTKFLLGGEKAQ